ncbi:unnamed protein product [Schistosoma haematobium]|nr:unnamed protein product [Schistosoma haematobium]
MLVNKGVMSSDSMVLPFIFIFLSVSTNSKTSLTLCLTSSCCNGSNNLTNHFAVEWYGVFAISSIGRKRTSGL